VIAAVDLEATLTRPRKLAVAVWSIDGTRYSGKKSSYVAS
jgi:hypothetical protein